MCPVLSRYVCHVASRIRNKHPMASSLSRGRFGCFLRCADRQWRGSGEAGATRAPFKDGPSGGQQQSAHIVRLV